VYVCVCVLCHNSTVYVNSRLSATPRLSLSHTHTFTRTHIHTHALTYTHTHSHTHTRTHIHTHALTYAADLQAQLDTLATKSRKMETSQDQFEATRKQSEAALQGQVCVCVCEYGDV
jgi:hypothetical protein